MLKKDRTLFITVFLVISTVFLILSQASGSDHNMMHSQDNLSYYDRSNTNDSIESVNPEMISQTRTEPLLQTDHEWQQDASVNFSYAFQDHFLNFESFKINEPELNDDILDLSHDIGLLATYYDDSKQYDIHYVDGDTDDTGTLTVQWTIRALTSGNLYYDLRVSGGWGGNTQDSSYSLNESYIDANGLMSFSVVVKDCDTFQLNVWKVSDNSPVQIFSVSLGAGSSWIDYSFYIDEIRFVQDPIISHIRSEFQTTENPDIINWRLQIPNHEYQSEISIPFPDYVSSDLADIQVNPTCSFSISTGILTLTDTIPTIYEIKSVYGPQKRYLANLVDVTANYFSDVDFEGSYSNDWVDLESRFDSVDLNSTIVHSGSFSLRLEDTSGGSNSPYLEALGSTALQDGTYYVSFAYFIEYLANDGGAADLRFKYWDSAWVIEYPDETTNRWIQYYTEVHIDGQHADSYGQFQFYGYAADIIIFIDCFTIYKVNPTISNPEYQKLSVEGTLANLVRPNERVPVPNEGIIVDLRDRTADSSLQSWNLTTDALGKWETSYSASLTQKEYELSVYCPESSWNEFFFQQSEYGVDGLSWREGEEEAGWSFVSGQAATTVFDSNPTHKHVWITGTSGDYRREKWTPSQSINAALYKYLEVRWASNYAGNRYVLRDGYYGISGWQEAAVAWEFQTDVYTADSDWSGMETILEIDFKEKSGEGDFDGDERFYFDYIKLIGKINQSAYFTPQRPEDFIFEYETANEWDFSEETDEGFQRQGGATTSIVPLDGYLRIAITNTAYNIVNMYLTNSSWTCSASTYTRLIIRIKGSEALRFVLYDSAWNMIVSYTTISTSYQIFDLDLTEDADWTGDDQVRLQLVETSGGGNFDADEYFWIDYIRLVARDSPVLTLESEYGYCESVNDSLKYWIDLNASRQGYFTDTELFPLDQSSGNYTVNATPYVDINRYYSHAFLPGTSLVTNYTISETAQTWDVFFAYYDALGIGLPFETFKLYINSSRHYESWLRDVTNGTFLVVTIKDGFNVLLYNGTYQILNDTEIGVKIDVYDAYFKNDSTERESYLEIWRNTQVLNMTIGKESMISHRFTEGEYEIKMYYKTDFNTTTRFKSMKISFSTPLKELGGSTTVDVTPPDPLPSFWEQRILPETLFMWDLSWITFTRAEIVAAIIIGLVVAIVGYGLRTRILQPVDEHINLPERGSSWSEKIKRFIWPRSPRDAHYVPLNEPSTYGERQAAAKRMNGRGEETGRGEFSRRTDQL